MISSFETIGNPLILHSAQVRAELGGYVRAYAETEFLGAEPETAPFTVASLETALQFDLFPSEAKNRSTLGKPSSQHVFLVGPRTLPGIRLQPGRRVHSFRIFFHPCGLWQLFRVRDSGLVNQVLPAAHSIGVEVESLALQMAECPSFLSRVGIVEDFLVRRAARASARTPIMNAAVSMFTGPDITRIDELAHHNGLGIRQFERRFALEIGMSPKLFARITRFQTALDAKLSLPTRSWLSIAHESGYHDQMHMIKDFQSLGGDSPERMLIRLGDTRPPALAASDKAALKKSLQVAAFPGSSAKH